MSPIARMGIALLLLLSTPVFADMFVSQEEQIMETERDLAKELATLPREKQAEAMAKMLEALPAQRAQLTKDIAAKKAEEAKGIRKYPFAQQMGRGFDRFDREEEVLKRWSKQGVPVMASPTPEGPPPAGRPIPIIRNPEPPVRQMPSPAVLVAGLLVAGGVLLGLRRALKRS